MAYSNHAEFIIDKDKCKDLTNVPIVFKGTFNGSDGNDIRSTTHGGDVENTDTGGASGALTVPADLTFSTDYQDIENTELDFEIQEYDEETGYIIAHIEMDSLSATQDPVFYMSWGDSDVTSSRESVAGTWGNDFDLVFHLCESSGTAYESANGDDASLTGTAPSEDGKIGKARDFNRTDKGVLKTTWHDSTIRRFTGSVWTRPSSDNTGERAIFSLEAANYGGTKGGVRDRGWGRTDPLSYGTQMIMGGSWCRADAGDDNCPVEQYSYVAARNNNTNIEFFFGTTKNTGASTGSESNNQLHHFWIADYSNDGDWQPNAYLDEIRFSMVDRSDDWLEVQYNTQDDPGSFYSSVNVLTGEDLDVGVLLAEGDLGQEHKIEGDSLLFQSLLGAGSIGQNHNLTGEDLSFLSVLGTGSIGQIHSLAGEDLSFLSVLGAGSIGQIHSLNGDELPILTVLGEPSIGQVHVLGGKDVLAIAVLDEGFLGQAHNLSGKALVVDIGLDGGVIGQTHALEGKDVISIIDIPEAFIGQAYSLSGKGLICVFDAQGGDLGQTHNLDGRDLNIPLAVSEGSLGQMHILVPTDLVVSVEIEEGHLLRLPIIGCIRVSIDRNDILASVDRLGGVDADIDIVGRVDTDIDGGC